MNKKDTKHIVISGNIGSGKTTLTKLLAKHYHWESRLDKVDDNPYLSDFYEDMRRWAFSLQVYFLHSRFNTVLDIQQSGQSVIQDRSIYEDAYIFAPNLHEMGLMSSRDFKSYSDLFDLMAKLVQPPDLLIYLRTEVAQLVKQIQNRGRQYESRIRLDYLAGLNERYEAWIAEYTAGPIIILDVANNNFSENPEALSAVIDKIDAKLFGLF
ncbi:MAG: deoxynucleoside kinase [Bacteroidia bacterium]|nr:MAG: deoxynucleoside kinase [Bacteroidia bacterium]